MEKEKQIEEMSRKIDEMYYVYDTTAEDIAKGLYEAGYGNVKEAVQEFAKRVKMVFYYEFDELIPSIMSDKIDELIKEVCGEK